MCLFHFFIGYLTSFHLSPAVEKTKENETLTTKKQGHLPCVCEKTRVWCYIPLWGEQKYPVIGANVGVESKIVTFDTATYYWFKMNRNQGSCPFIIVLQEESYETTTNVYRNWEWTAVARTIVTSKVSELYKALCTI